VRENAPVSNPYAPPEKRPDTPDDAPVQHAPVWPPAGTPSTVPVAPEPQPADPEGTVRALDLTRLFTVLVLASVLVTMLRLPWQAAALPFALAAIIVGVRAMVVTVRARARGLTPVLAVGLVVSVLWTLSVAVTLAQWEPRQTKQACLEGALTIGARNACESQFQKDLDDLYSSLPERGTGA
jgi:hypothetical protein